MNLAEIRKKAQLEKSAVKGVVPTDRTRPSTDANDNIPVHWEAEPEYTVSVDAEVSACPEETEKLPITFDPLAILLAGRRAAACSSDNIPAPLADQEAVERLSLKYISFRVSTEEYAINLLDIKEIIKLREITEVPHAPVFLKGIISLRGIIVPVFDMCARLGFARSTPTGKERIIIVRKMDGCCGLLVDEVFQVVKLEQQPIESPPTVLEGTNREFISGIGRHGDHMLILMDLEKIMDVALQ